MSLPHLARSLPSLASSPYSAADSTPDDCFLPLLNHINLSAFPQLALTLCPSAISCNVDPTPLTGSFHILYRVTFDIAGTSDHSTWLFKIPACGHPEGFTPAVARALVSEAKTMQLIRRQTSIPVPIVYAFDAGLDNPIKVPYIALQFFQGLPLCQRWFNPTIQESVLDQIAVMMASLGSLRFPCGGALEFSEGKGWSINGEVAVVGPVKRPEIDPTNPDETVFREVGPFEGGLREYLTAHLDSHQEPLQDEYGKGLEMLLKLFISWIPDSVSRPGEFVVAHPDFNLQNFLVEDVDGTEVKVCAVIDWDGVAAVPKAVGNERYPAWLTRDWDPVMYGWQEQMKDGQEERQEEEEETWRNKDENSPEELARLRRLYVQLMENCKKEDATITKHAHIWEAMEIAADNRVSFHAIVRKIFEEAVREEKEQDVEDAEDAEDAEEEEEGELLAYDVACALAAGREESSVIDRIKKGFLKLCGVV